MLNDSLKENLIKEFKKLKNPVKIVLRKGDNKLSEKLEKILKEVSTLSEKLSFEISDRLDCIDYPCFSIFKDNKDIGIRYMGSIEGGEFKNLIDSIKLVSTGDIQLEDRTLSFLEELDKPIDLKVFITISCGWCPPTVLKCYNFTLANLNIRTTVIDCFSFPELANRYNVITVPKIVINDKVELVGYRSENEILGSIFSAI